MPGRGIQGLVGEDQAALLGAVFSELEVTFSATPRATAATARLSYAD